jgi:hypothetical protein
METETQWQTTRDTLKANKCGIDTAKIPTLFSDAIEFTRKLEIRCLWIDRVCIIQDDENDTLNEIAQMSEVYSKATVTLAATKARNPTESLFSSLSAKERLTSFILLSQISNLFRSLLEAPYITSEQNPTSHCCCVAGFSKNAFSRDVSYTFVRTS